MVREGLKHVPRVPIEVRPLRVIRGAGTAGILFSSDVIGRCERHIVLTVCYSYILRTSMPCFFCSLSLLSSIIGFLFPFNTFFAVINILLG